MESQRIMIQVITTAAFVAVAILMKPALHMDMEGTGTRSFSSSIPLEQGLTMTSTSLSPTMNRRDNMVTHIPTGLQVIQGKHPALTTMPKR